jgi:beta-1,4-N-acetylglucosaminyltransferase
MIFLTVGTQFPFDRMVKAVDEFIDTKGFEGEIYGQIGNSAYKPRNFEAVESLEKHLFDSFLREASCIISHAGMGTITMALEHNKPLLVMPRLAKFGEAVNDHQVAIAKKFEQLGHILVAYSQDWLPEKIEELKSFVPQPRKTQTKLIVDRIVRFINEL